jgi:hypothetical protein
MGELKNAAFDSFYADGVADERSRILAICYEIAQENSVGEYVYLSDLKEYLVDPDAPYPRSLILAMLSAELDRVKKLSFKQNIAGDVIRTMSAIETAMNSIRSAKLLVDKS